MTEGDYLKALELIKDAERNIREGDYDLAHIAVIEALTLLDERERVMGEEDERL